MPRHEQPRRSLLPKSVVRPAWHLATVFLTLTLLAACSLPFGASSAADPARSGTPGPTATSTSALAGKTVYWSQGTVLFALRANDGHVRWKVGGWTVTLPSGNGFIGGLGAPTLA